MTRAMVLRGIAAQALASVLACSLPAAAMVGGAQPASDGAGRATVMLTGSHGTFCSGVALARYRAWMVEQAGKMGSPLSP